MLRDYGQDVVSGFVPFSLREGVSILICKEAKTAGKTYNRRKSRTFLNPIEDVHLESMHPQEEDLFTF